MWDAPDPRRDDSRERSHSDPREHEERNPREIFASGLDLPRGPERERVYVHEHEYDVRGSEARALATIGAFRVVPASDLRDDHGRQGDVRHCDLERLRNAGLIRRIPPVEGERLHAL